MTEKAMMVEQNKTISVRLSDDVVVQLETLARFDGVAVAEEIREGIALLLAAKKQDPEFRERVQTVLEDAKRLLAEIGSEDVAEALGSVPSIDDESASERVPALAGAGASA